MCLGLCMNIFTALFFLFKFQFTCIFGNYITLRGDLTLTNSLLPEMDIYCSMNLLYMGAIDSSYWVKGTSQTASSRRRPEITSRRKEIQAMPIDHPYDVYTWAICSRPIRLSVSSRAFWEYLMYKLTPERVRRPEKTHAQARINAHTQTKPIKHNFLDNTLLFYQRLQDILFAL